MDTVQKKILELLVKIDEICRDNSIKYFLGNETALCAIKWGRFAENCSGASIYMLPEDYNKFETIAIENPDEHTIESMTTNAEFPFTFMHYVDKETTRINTSILGLQKHPGIAVKIIKIIPYTPRKNNDLLRDKIALAALRTEHAFGTAVNYPVNYSSFRATHLRYDADMAVNVYKSDLLLEEDAPVQVYVQQYRKKALIFKENYFKKDPTIITLEGIDFPVPHDYNSFIAKIYGRTWQSRDITFNPLNNDFIIDTENPYSSYMTTAEELIDTSKNYRNVKEERISLMDQKNKLDGYIEDQRIYYERTVDRFKCIDKYIAEKDKIMSLYKRGDFYTLSVLLTEYQNISEQYITKNIPFAFDKDFYYIMCDTLLWQNMKSLRQKMLKSKKAAFKYLDKTMPDSEQELSEALYRHIRRFRCMMNKKTPVRIVPLASAEDLETLAIKRYEISTQDDEENESGEKVFDTPGE